MVSRGAVTVGWLDSAGVCFVCGLSGLTAGVIVMLVTRASYPTRECPRQRDQVLMAIGSGCIAGQHVQYKAESVSGFRCVCGSMPASECRQWTAESTRFGLVH